MNRAMQTPEIYQIPDELNHFLVALLLLIIIFAALGIWLFAKWLTASPWFKRKYKKIFKKEKDNVEGIEVVKGEIVVDANYINELDEKIKNAETPQKLLELQYLKEENHENGRKKNGKKKKKNMKKSMEKENLKKNGRKREEKKGKDARKDKNVVEGEKNDKMIVMKRKVKGGWK